MSKSEWKENSFDHMAEQFAKGNELEKTIRENLKRIGYEL